jgi:FkbM family methyltransferase
MLIIESNGIKVDLGHPAVTPTTAHSFQQGIFEKSEVRITKAILKPGDRVLELGTCTGYVAMTAAKIVGAENVFSYEANPEIIPLAEHHFALNQLWIELKNCVLLARAKAMNRPKTIAFHVGGAPTSSSIKRKKDATIYEVPVQILEDEIARHQANVLIMDIEGAEVEILPFADLTGIEHILMETHYRKAGRRAVDMMIADLYARGFAIDLGNSIGTVVHLDRVI